MKINSLEVKNFRNIEFAQIIPDAEINIFCGENGTGKTNLLEAVWMLSGAKSFRKAKDKELIKFGSEFSEVNAEIFSKQVQREVSLKIAEKRKAFIEEKEQKLPSELSEYFNASVFSPLDLSLALDGPAVRRKFMDLCLSQLFPKYLISLKNYQRSLDQRNAVLRDIKYHSSLESLLDTTEATLASSAEVITSFRERLCEHFAEIFPKMYEGLAGNKEKADIKYISSGGKNLAQILFESRKDDILYGNTSFGPHRDDFLLTLDNNETRIFSSQGQKRCAALSLKLAEAEVIKNVRGEEPVILLDDVMSELDPTRQKRLISMMSGRQVFITCCDSNNISSLKAGKLFNIAEGKII